MTGATGTYSLLAQNQAATGTGVATQQIQPFKAFQATGTTTSGNVAGTVDIEGSIDGINFKAILTLTITSGSSPVTAIAAGTYPYPWIRSNVTAISGTGAAISVYCAV